MPLPALGGFTTAAGTVQISLGETTRIRGRATDHFVADRIKIPDPWAVFICGVDVNLLIRVKIP